MSDAFFYILGVFSFNCIFEFEDFGKVDVKLNALQLLLLSLTS